MIKIIITIHINDLIVEKNTIIIIKTFLKYIHKCSTM